MRTNVPFRSNHNLVCSCKYHVVWCPKYRRPVLVNEVETRLKEILLQTAQDLRSEIIELEVVSDHVHLLCEVDPQFGINRLVGRLKGRSSRLLRQEFPHLKRLPSLWTNSYPSTSLRPSFVATVGGAPLAVIKQYIEQQKDEKWQKPRPTRSSSRFRSR
jgi:putative transposase